MSDETQTADTTSPLRTTEAAAPMVADGEGLMVHASVAADPVPDPEAADFAPEIAVELPPVFIDATDPPDTLERLAEEAEAIAAKVAEKIETFAEKAVAEVETLASEAVTEVKKVWNKHLQAWV